MIKKLNKQSLILIGLLVGLLVVPIISFGARLIQTWDIADKAVTTRKLAKKAVTSNRIYPKAVNTYKIADKAVTSKQIAPGAVVNPKIAANAVTSDKILDGTINSGDVGMINSDDIAGITINSDVTAMGLNALYNITLGGLRNVAFGSGALATNTTADDNVGIGDSALAAVDGTGNRNTAVGNYALDANINGVWNVGVGYGVLGNGTGLEGSTAVGYLALSLASGDNNVGIGYQAGNSITSGQNNIVIGYDADVPSPTSSNQLNIGGLLLGDLSSDYLAIGGSTIPTGAFLEILQNASGGVAHIELNPIANPPATDVDTGDIYMDTDGILYVRSTSNWAAANTASDFSELIVPLGFRKEIHDGVIHYVGDIEAGDLVVINDDGYYERSSKPYDPSVVGVESGNRGRFRLKAGSLEREEGQRQVGIMGHILVKVSLENGPIRPGDSLTTSSLPGHAMKTTKPGFIVGKALKSFYGSQGKTGMIEVLVNPGWFGGICGI